jgi:hypothetical protein
MAYPQHSTTAPAAFITDLIWADLFILASPSGKLDLYARQMELDPAAGGYREVPRHPEAAAMAARFDALTESELAGLAAYVRTPHQSVPAEGRG